MFKTDIIRAYGTIRKENHTIPDDVLDFMFKSALERLDSSESKPSIAFSEKERVRATNMERKRIIVRIKYWLMIENKDDHISAVYKLIDILKINNA
jgi:hypothetical protein